MFRSSQWQVVLGASVLLLFMGCSDSADPPATESQPPVITDVSEPAIIDADGDKIADNDDRCADTPVGRAVDEYGCQPDLDSDGVVMALDRCLDTPAGTAVDRWGCATLTEATRFVPEIVFKTGSASLVDAEAIEQLAQVREAARLYKDAMVRVVGYTDDRGDERANERLSLRRAQAVADLMMRQGISEARLAVEGFGEADPLADNTTAEGRATNRRIEVTLEPRLEQED